MEIVIDGKKTLFYSEDKSIVDAADRAGIAIPAPCYRAGDGGGCCKACLVEVDGKTDYACSVKPVDGMNIVVNRNDLKAVRKESLATYLKKKRNSLASDETQTEGCGCGCSCGSSSPNGCS